MRGRMRTEDNVKIITASGIRKLEKLEEKISYYLTKGYSLSGGITVLSSEIVVAVVVKPF